MGLTLDRGMSLRDWTGRSQSVCRVLLRFPPDAILVLGSVREALRMNILCANTLSYTYTAKKVGRKSLCVPSTEIDQDS